LIGRSRERVSVVSQRFESGPDEFAKARKFFRAARFIHMSDDAKPSSRGKLAQHVAALLRDFLEDFDLARDLSSR
jgi:hypothetical protein